MRTPILVAPVHLPPQRAVAAARARISERFDLDVSETPPMPDVGTAYHPGRRQYDSTLLLRQMHRVFADTDSKIIGITDVDLFIPVLTFVFGESQLNGRLAIVSTYRLQNSVYGLPDDPEALRSRLEKECLHELGHTFGLLHCPRFHCVMNSSTAVEDIDIKGSDYCSECSEKLPL
jgi:archaemetzincin